MQHEEESFACAVKCLTNLQGVGEKGPKHLPGYGQNLGLLRKKKWKKIKNAESDTTSNLVEGVLDDDEHRRFCPAQLPVEGLEAGAVTGRAVSQLPGATNRPGRKLLT